MVLHQSMTNTEVYHIGFVYITPVLNEPGLFRIYVATYSDCI